MMKISFLSRILDLLSPRLCPICGRRLSITERTICGPCELLYLPYTYFEMNPYENRMARHFWGQFPIEKAAGMFFYFRKRHTNRVIFKMKYFNHPETGVELGQMLARRFQPWGFFDDITAIMPMPLAKKRQKQRGYNQSMMLAQGISKVTGIPVIDGIVERLTFSESQTKKGPQERRENVKNAFRLKSTDDLSGSHILIVDDVVTTGWTVIACAQQLAKAGDLKISVASVAVSHYI